MASTPSQVTVDFFSALREREAQAQAFGNRHLESVADTESMLYWLAEAARKARLTAGRKQVHVAASYKAVAKEAVDQSTIARFEKHIAWPRDADAMIAAYADDLNVTAVELWSAAVEMWREDAGRAKPPRDPLGLAEGFVDPHARSPRETGTPAPVAKQARRRRAG